jgi:plastocyanin
MRDFRRIIPVSDGELTRWTRREFVSRLGMSAAGLLAGGALASCGSSSDAIPTVTGDVGRIAGTIEDIQGQLQPSLGRIFLMYSNGLQTGRYVDVDSKAQFAFDNVAPGEWQLRFHAPKQARVPEELPNPLRVTVTANQTAAARFRVSTDPYSDTVVEIYAGDEFFQEQPLGTATTIVSVGTVICWYNVGNMLHTVTGGPWGDSGDMLRTASFDWLADTPGVYPYRCKYHSPQMQGLLTVMR